MLKQHAKKVKKLPPEKKQHKQTNPQRIIIELGDNFADYKNPKFNESVTKKEVVLMVNALDKYSPHSTCYWITPTRTDKPATGAYKKTNERLKQVITAIKKYASTRCTDIDSTQDIGLSQNDLSTVADGIHFNSTNGRKWANAVAKKIFALETEDNNKPTTNRKLSERKVF